MRLRTVRLNNRIWLEACSQFYAILQKLLFPLGKAASCGDNMIKIHELSDLKETSSVITLDDERGLENMDWSEDGQLLAVTTSKGNLHVYLSKLPLLSSSSHTRVSSILSLLKVFINYAFLFLFVFIFATFVILS